MISYQYSWGFLIQAVHFHAGRSADLLTAASRQVMIELVGLLFGELGSIPRSPLGAHTKLPSILAEGPPPGPGSDSAAAPAQPESAGTLAGSSQHSDTDNSASVSVFAAPA